jgi:2,3-bisphosphoglycerate-dependent phosphoglycerate mutase
VIELWYETHSTTEDNLTGVNTGWLDGRLTAEGRQQALAMGERRADVDVVVHSDLGRAVETASLAFPSTPRLADWRLRECDYGSMNGVTHERGSRARYLEQAYPGGESWREAVARNLRVLADLRPRWEGARVLLVGHAATRWAMLTHFEALRLEDLVVEDVPWQPGWSFSC